MTHRFLLPALLVSLTQSTLAFAAISNLERGLHAFTDGDYATASRALESWRREGHMGDPDGALLLGISYYHLGRAADARVLFDGAACSIDREIVQTARLYQGLVAADDGDL